MKILIYNGYNAAPHLETELELALDLKAEGHDVFFVKCKGELLTCFDNPQHDWTICRSCISKKEMGLKLIKTASAKIIDFPKVEVDEHLIPDEFENIQEVKQFSYEGVDIGMAVASSLISQYRDHKLDVKKYKKEVQNGIKTALFTYLSGKVILDNIKPDQVIIFNGRFLEIRPFMRLCEQRNITFYTHERGGTLQKYLLRKNDIPHSLTAGRDEMLQLWEDGPENKRAIGEKFFTDRRNKVIQSWHVFTKHQEIGKLPDGFNKDIKNIAIFNSSMDEYEGIAGFINKIYNNDNEGIRLLLEGFADQRDVHFYLRCHPNLKSLKNSQMREIEEIGRKYKNNLTIIWPEEIIDTYALMDACDTLVAFNSTLGAEACFWGKPVVLLGNAFYGELKGLYKPSNHQETLDLLRQDLKPLDNSDMLKYGYWELNKGIPFKYYEPKSVIKGIFLGVEIKQDLFTRLLNGLTRRLRRIWQQ